MVMGDDEILVRVLRGWVSNAIWDGVQVNKFISDVFKRGAVFLNDFLNLLNLNFNWGVMSPLGRQSNTRLPLLGKTITRFSLMSNLGADELTEHVVGLGSRRLLLRHRQYS